MSASWTACRVAICCGAIIFSAAPAAHAQSLPVTLPSSSAHYGWVQTQRIRFQNAPLFKQANAAADRQDTTAAIGLFAEILKNDPGSNPAKLALIALYERQEHFDHALLLCNNLLQRYPDWIDGWRMKGALALKIHDETLAAESWTEVLRRAPDNARLRQELLRELAPLLVRLGRAAAAGQAYRQALAMAYDPAMALEYAYVLKALSDPAKERTLLELILARPAPPALERAAIHELAQLDRQAGRKPEYVQGMTRLVQTETDARQLFDYGQQLYTAGDQVLALTALTRCFDLTGVPSLKFDLGLFTANLLLEQRRPADARAWLQKITTLADTDVRWPLTMARADYLAGNYRDCGDRLMTLKERPASANLLIGMAFMKRNLPGPALDFFNAIDRPDALSRDEQLSLFGNRAYLDFDQNQYPAARADAVAAGALAPSAAMALLHLKALADVSASNDIEKTGTSLLDPEKSGLRLTGAEQAQVLLVMGRDLYRQEQYARAVQQLTEAAKLDPQLAEAFYLRGLAYRSLGKSQETLTNYQKYIRLEPQPPASFWGDLGQAFGGRQEYKQGTEALQRSLAYHSVDVDTLSDQGYQFMKWAFPHQGTNRSVLNRWNHNREAKQSFQQAIDLYADLVPRVPTNETTAYRNREVAMKQEYTKLDRVIGIQAYISRTDYGFPTNVGISSVDGALPSQGGLELSLRPPIIGFLNERTLDVFGNVSGNFQRQTWTPDSDSYQGMVGLRVKPFIRFNYNMSLARLFKIGDNAEDNWLWRNMASWEHGAKPAPGKTVGLNLKGFGDIGYYFEPRARWYGYLDGRAGPCWRLCQDALLILPQVMGILRYETNDEGDTGSYGLAGIGATLRLFEPERRRTINRIYADLFIDYTWGQFMSTPNGFDGRSFEGPLIGLSLVK